MGLRCPMCYRTTKTVDSRPKETNDGRPFVIRIIECRHCKVLYRTFEYLEQDLEHAVG